MRGVISKLLPRTLAHATAITCLAGVGYVGAAQAEAPVKAVWTVQELTVPYFGLTTQYSCDGIRDRVRKILSDLGAKDHSVVSVSGCTELVGPTKNPTVHIVVLHPVPAEAAKSVQTDEAKRAKLLATLKRAGKHEPTAEPFDAVTKKVILSSKDSASTSAAGDCELLEQMRDYVFKPMGAKILKDDVRCTPYQGTVGNLRMEVEVLAPAPKNS